MSKVTEELDFLWRERLLEVYNELMRYASYGGPGGIRCSNDIKVIVRVLAIQGLTVKGIEN